MAVDDHHVPIGEFSKLEKADGEALIVDFGSLMPIGAVIAWHKSFANTPSLNVGWVECNGQTLSDDESVYDGQAIPDLNGDGRFIRGSATSGIEQADEFKAHTHEYGTFSPVGQNTTGSTKARNPTSGTTDPTGGSETRPINISMVWIMKVK